MRLEDPYCDSCDQFECLTRGCLAPGRCQCETCPTLARRPPPPRRPRTPAVARRRAANKTAGRSRRANR